MANITPEKGRCFIKKNKQNGIVATGPEKLGKNVRKRKFSFEIYKEEKRLKEAGKKWYYGFKSDDPVEIYKEEKRFKEEKKKIEKETIEQRKERLFHNNKKLKNDIWGTPK